MPLSSQQYSNNDCNNFYVFSFAFASLLFNAASAITSGLGFVRLLIRFIVIIFCTFIRSTRQQKKTPPGEREEFLHIYRANIRITNILQCGYNPLTSMVRKMENGKYSQRHMTAVERVRETEMETKYSRKIGANP